MPNTSTVHQLKPRQNRPRAETLGDEITQLCGYIYAAEHRLLGLIREFDDNQYWAEIGVASCAHWLQWKCGFGMNAAREKVRVAHALAALPQISQAFAGGEISYSKVRALSRVATPENEEDLLMIARHGTAHHVERLVAQARRLERLEDLAQANDNHAARSLDYYHDEDGCLVLKARLPAEQGAPIIKALEAAMERQHTRRDVTAVTPPPKITTRRADALADIAESWLNTEPVPNSTADRYQVIVHMPADEDVTAVTPHIENGPHLCHETTRRIACDAALLPVRDDDSGEPLTIGRKTRSIPPAMRRALRLRDGGCRFPGCTRSHFVDGHHIRHWADGGETALDNLVQLCRQHHRLVHEGGFSCRRLGDGQIVFEAPGGRRLESAQRLPRLADGRKLEEVMEDLYVDLQIDAETCVTRWQGERMDWGMALGIFDKPAARVGEWSIIDDG